MCTWQQDCALRTKHLAPDCALGTKILTQIFVPKLNPQTKLQPKTSINLTSRDDLVTVFDLTHNNNNQFITK